MGMQRFGADTNNPPAALKNFQSCIIFCVNVNLEHYRRINFEARCGSDS